MYILKFLHFAKENRPKRISDSAYLGLPADEASHYKHENDETEYAPAISDDEDYALTPGNVSSDFVFDTTDYSTPSTPVDDTPAFSGFGGGDFGGAGSSGSWGDSSSSSSDNSSSGDSGSSSSYDSGSSSDSSSSSSDW